ncbi:unnamed protein product, partial [Prorocentrum cordatum]
GARFGLQTAKMARLFPRQSRWRRKRRRRRRRRGRNEEEGGEGGAPACAQQRSTHTQHTKNYGVRVRAAGRAANADSGSSERGRSQRGHAGRDLESIWVGSGERGGGATGRRPGAPRGRRPALEEQSKTRGEEKRERERKTKKKKKGRARQRCIGKAVRRGPLLDARQCHSAAPCQKRRRPTATHRTNLPEWAFVSSSVPRSRGRIERGPDGAGACRAAAEGHMPTPRARPCHGGG